MNKDITPKKILQNSIFFIVLIGITFFLLLKDNNLSEILMEVKKAKKIYIIIGILCTFIYVICEATNLRTVLSFFSYKKSLLSMLKYSFIGFLFSSITPSASGGQPMQIYYMAKESIDVSHGALAIFMEFASFQLVTISLAIIFSILNFKLILGFTPLIIFLVVIGIMFNTVILIILLCIIFSNTFSKKIGNFIFWIINKIKFIKITNLKEKIDEQINEYQKGAVFIKENKDIIFKVIATTLVQVIALYSITFWVYRALGFNEASFIKVISLQAILYVAVSGIPLPGAVGVSESTFLKIFKTIYPVQVLSSAMLLSRGISFYLFVLISGVVVVTNQIMITKRKSISR